jgi:hypothetical protein
VNSRNKNFWDEAEFFITDVLATVVLNATVITMVGLTLFTTLFCNQNSVDDSQCVPCNQSDTRERQPYAMLSPVATLGKSPGGGLSLLYNTRVDGKLNDFLRALGNRVPVGLVPLFTTLFCSQNTK